jgi:site-specific DNA-methyltransferase (adenine-specific)/modification methylase
MEIIFNEDCFESMKRFEENGDKVNVILTSPPYNTGRPNTSEKARKNNEARYDIHMDTMTQDEYIDWTIKLFNEFDKILAKDGVILWNISYGSDGTVNTSSIGLVWLVIADIIRKTNFTTADRIIWKKKSALPNNVSKNKLTRIVEDVFVFCRKNEYKTFQCNKEVSSVGKTGQTFYKIMYNFIEAPNNDGSCILNKATYSSELCEKLLTMYANNANIVYDPFMGTGTTAVACKRLGINCFGSEISKDQVDYAYERLKNVE